MLAMECNVVAVVVTFNRKELLLRCVKNIIAQTYKVKKIVVVDNASTDGSEKYIEQNIQDFQSIIQWVRLKTNQGGAGGFYEGMKEAAKSDNYLWLMDDDGFPESNCLKNLLLKCDKNSFVGPVVLSDKDKYRLSFTIRKPGTRKVYKDYKDLKESSENSMLEGIVIPFNGVLLHSDLIKRFGLPRKEYFIWGDDMEFMWRLKRGHVKISTNLNSFFYHPISAQSEKMFFGLLYFNNTNSDLKLYCMARNTTKNLLDYRGGIFVLLYLMKLIWFFSFTTPDIRKLKLTLLASYHGLTANFAYNKKFIR